MELIIKGHEFGYEMESVCRIFLGPEKIITTNEKGGAEEYLLTELKVSGDKIELYAQLSLKGKSESQYALSERSAGEKEWERALGVAAYKCFSRILGVTPPWGALTGIRPVKLAAELKDKGCSDEEVVSEFKKNYLVAEDKARLMVETEKHETDIIKRSGEKSFSLYIGIPFCPTRCKYCSFVSHAIEKTRKLIPEYVEKLVKEISFTGEMVKRLGLELETVYMGGGTPTTLSAKELEVILSAVNESFDVSGVKEYTVEAGRPDTITRDRLEALKRCGVDRISVNPQTMNDKILEVIGRKHTSEQTLEGYRLAREVGFDVINMDVIAGLPGESVDSFCRTMDILTELKPENITVHTLSIKRSAELAENGRDIFIKGGERAAEMLEYSQKKLKAEGYFPYYLYRQKNMLGSLENVGFSLSGKEGLYNVYIMDETHTIFAVGAGASTKLKDQHSGRIERIFNYKFPYEYIERFDSVIERKRKAEEFYDANRGKEAAGI